MRERVCLLGEDDREAVGVGVRGGHKLIKRVWWNVK